MTRGVSFKCIPSKNILHQIFKCIDVEKFSWHNIDDQDEVWDSPQGSKFFNKDCYDGESFSKHIQSEQFIVFTKLQAYSKNCDSFSIHSYEEFLNSNCQLLLLMYDCLYVEIYAKDGVVINDIYENAINNGYTEVKFITDENDGRTKLDVL